MCIHCSCVVYRTIDEIGVRIVNGAAVLNAPNETVMEENPLEVMAARFEEDDVQSNSFLTTIRLENDIYKSDDEIDESLLAFVAPISDEEDDSLLSKRRRDEE